MINSSFLFPVGVWQLKDVPNVPPVHDVEGHDKGHHARPRLHGGVPRGGPIARGAQVDEALLHRPPEVVSSLELEAGGLSLQIQRWMCCGRNFANTGYGKIIKYES